jgi:hypothetical protein
VSWVWTKELHRGRTFKQAEKNVRTYTRNWLILTNDRNDRQLFVANNSALPTQYTPYPDDPFALRLGLDVNPHGDESGMLWEASATYSTNYENQKDQNPFNRPPLMTITCGTYTVPVLKEVTSSGGEGKTITNWAGDYYDPLPEKHAPQGQIKFKRNEPELPLPAISKYVGKVNSDNWFNNAPRTWLCMGINCGELKNENGYQFYEVDYEFHFKEKNWDAKLLEIGYNGLNEGKKFKFNYEVPQLLWKIDDQNIDYIPKDIPLAGALKMATFTSWKIYEEAPFNDLGLI